MDKACNVKFAQYGPIIVNGYTYPFIDRQIFDLWSENLTYVSSFSYRFTETGERFPLNDEDLILATFQNEVAPLMVITPINEEGYYSNELEGAVLNNVIARRN